MEGDAQVVWGVEGGESSRDGEDCYQLVIQLCNNSTYPIEYRMDRNPDWNVFRNIDFCSGVASGASGKGKKTKQEVAGSRTMIRFVLDALGGA